MPLLETNLGCFQGIRNLDWKWNELSRTENAIHVWPWLIYVMNCARRRKNRGSLVDQQIHSGNRCRQNHILRNGNEHQQYQGDSYIWARESEYRATHHQMTYCAHFTPRCLSAKQMVSSLKLRIMKNKTGTNTTPQALCERDTRSYSVVLMVYQVRWGMHEKGVIHELD